MSQGTPEKLLFATVKKKITEKPLTSSQIGALGTLATNARQIAQVTQAAVPVQAQTRTVKLMGHGPELKKWKDRFAAWKVDVEPAFDAAPTWDAFDQLMTRIYQALEASPMNVSVQAEANRLVQAYVAGKPAAAAPSTVRPGRSRRAR